MRRTSLLGPAAAVLLLAAACGGSGEQSDDELRADVSEQLQNGGDGLAEEQADCFAEILIDEVGADELRDVDLSADEPPAGLQDEISAAAVRAVEECDLADVSG